VASVALLFFLQKRFKLSTATAQMCKFTPIRFKCGCFEFDVEPEACMDPEAKDMFGDYKVYRLREYYHRSSFCTRITGPIPTEGDGISHCEQKCGDCADDDKGLGQLDPQGKKHAYNAKLDKLVDAYIDHENIRWDLGKAYFFLSAEHRHDPDKFDLEVTQDLEDYFVTASGASADQLEELDAALNYFMNKALALLEAAPEKIHHAEVEDTLDQMSFRTDLLHSRYTRWAEIVASLRSDGAHTLRVRDVFDYPLRADIFSWLKTFELDDEQMDEGKIIQTLVNDMAHGTRSLDIDFLQSLRFFEFASDAVTPPKTS
jgi:hypothetical protein